jgi:hypothetical protein
VAIVKGRGGYNVGMMLQVNFGKSKFASDRAFEEKRGAYLPIKCTLAAAPMVGNKGDQERD